MSFPPAWDAAWIWPRDLRAAGSHVLLRRDFDLERKPASARLRIAAETYARVWLNGEWLHQTSSISYPQRHTYEEVEAASLLRAGRNRIGVLVRYLGIPSGDSCPKDPGLALELYCDGGLVLYTDDSWGALVLDAWHSPRRRSRWFNLALIEECDLRRLPAGWPLPELGPDFVQPEATGCPGGRTAGLRNRRRLAPAYLRLGTGSLPGFRRPRPGRIR